MPLPAHIAWLAANRGPALRDCLQAQGVEMGVDAALQVLMAADPSPGAHAVQWLCDSLIGGGYLWEDVAAGRDSKAAETLDLFALHRASLARGHRNLEDHASLASLYQSIQPLLEANDPDRAEGGRALRRAQRMQAYQDSIIVCNTPELLVAVPLNHEASQWWGRGTRWCTAMENSDFFDRYHETAPLIVICMPDIEDSTGTLQGGKLQLHLEPGRQGLRHRGSGIQFNNAADGNVGSHFIDLNWNRLGGLMRWAMEVNPDMIEHIPSTRLSHADWLAYVQVQGRWQGCALRRVPPDMRTAEICLAALRWTPRSMSVVPRQVLTPQFIQSAIDQGINVLAYMPPGTRVSRNLYMAAVRGHGKALALVPWEYRKRALCMAAVLADGYAIESVPDHLLDSAFHRAAVGSNGYALALECLPKTGQLCALAVQTTPDALEFVPLDLRTAQMCHDAVLAMPAVLEHVPHALHSAAMCMHAIQSSGRLLVHVAPHLLNADLCMQAVANGAALQSVPTHLLTAQMCRVALKLDPWVIDRVPSHMLTWNMCARAVCAQGGLLRHVPEHWRTTALCQRAVALHGLDLAYVPYEVKTQELCARAVAEDCQAIAHVPRRFRTARVYAAAGAGQVAVPGELKEEVDALLGSNPGTLTPAHKWNTSVLDGLAQACLEHIEAARQLALDNDAESGVDHAPAIAV